MPAASMAAATAVAPTAATALGEIDPWSQQPGCPGHDCDPHTVFEHDLNPLRQGAFFREAPIAFPLES
jgi:hypothetical protein